MSVALTKDASFTVPLQRRILLVGRDPSCDLILKGVGVSHFHARLHLDNQNVTIEDMENSSGLFLNGQLIHKASLPSESTLAIGVNNLSIKVTATSLVIRHVNELTSASAMHDAATSCDITIGRDSANGIHLSHPLISRFHAVARKAPSGEFFLEDLGSTNGTFVNGKPIHRVAISDGDIIHVGPFRFFYDRGKFHQAHDFNRIRLEAFNIGVVKKKRTLIDDISLSIQPGEFVVILGPSGSGKTTLAHALMGQTPLREGAIFYNGLPIKTFFGAFHSLIGFVSQENLLRPELTIAETFKEQSLLRLPRDSAAAERHERIKAVMDILGLSSMASCRVADLSGGEAKRVHFGIELLSSPTIVYFDEPFAGLDPGLIQKFMAIFRSFCDKGHTLLLTTHTIEHLNSCDRVLFMSGGKLLFSGAPNELLTNYHASSLPEVYEKVKSISSKEETFSGKPCEKNKSFAHYATAAALPKLFKAKGISLWRQFAMLVARYAKMTLRDRKNMMLMLLQSPLIALVLMFTYKRDIDAFPISFYFCVSLSAIWMGGMNSIREIAREWPLIEREFRIGLSPSMYCLSKLFVFGIGSIFQATFFGFCLDFFFPSFAMNGVIGVLLVSACVSGALLGLCMSVMSKNVNMAISWLPIIFIPQIFFSGILIPFDEMSQAGRLLSYGTISRYIFSIFKKICFLDQPFWPMPEWNGLFLLCIGLIILMIAGIKNRRFIFN